MTFDGLNLALKFCTKRMEEILGRNIALYICLRHSCRAPMQGIGKGIRCICPGLKHSSAIADCN